MSGTIIDNVGALRWSLPVRTPSDEATQDRMECMALDAAAELVRNTPIEARREPLDPPLPGQEGPAFGDNTDRALRAGDEDGRDLIADAIDRANGAVR